ncbi:hypothetical protein AB0M83_10170 [Amycolatopsis sp. NPDC051106]|uniref:hypothetical protein n=1 Tax=unclassified Amycolatopsis TaxID=2618356 RepID=UPI00343223DE
MPAHERAHVRGHHHLLTGCSVVLGRTVRFVPLMRDLPTAVRLLVELSADQAAAAHCGREPLRSALLSIQAVDGPRRALPMAGGDTAIRLDTAPSSAGRRPATALKAVVLVGAGSPLVCP